MVFGEDPYYDLAGSYSHNYDLHHQVAQRYVDDLVEMGHFKTIGSEIGLTPSGRRVCFSHPEIDLSLYINEDDAIASPAENSGSG